MGHTWGFFEEVSFLEGKYAALKKKYSDGKLLCMLKGIVVFVANNWTIKDICYNREKHKNHKLWCITVPWGNLGKSAIP